MNQTTPTRPRMSNRISELIKPEIRHRLHCLKNHLTQIEKKAFPISTAYVKKH